MKQLDWPSGFERTPGRERENTNKFESGVRQTKRQIRAEMDRMGVDEWRLDDVTGSSSSDPGVVLRWAKDGQDYAVACDKYTNKKDNIRSIYLWVNETRMRSQRPVVTGNSEFAAARLPSGREEDEAIVLPDEPHEVLGIAPDASERMVRVAYQEKMKNAHPDQGGTRMEKALVEQARDEMLGEE